MLLLDRWRASSMNNDPRTGRRRQSAETPRTRPFLHSLRDHATFQTTDCATPTTSATAQFVQSDTTTMTGGDFSIASPSSGARPPPPCLSRQSTVGTISSIDEGVEVDFIATSSIAAGAGSVLSTIGSRAPFSSGEIVASGCESSTGSGSIVGSPFESFDSQIETDVMSSFSSCPPTSEGSTTSAG